MWFAWVGSDRLVGLGFGYVGCDWVGLGGFAPKEAIFVVILMSLSGDQVLGCPDGI